MHWIYHEKKPKIPFADFSLSEAIDFDTTKKPVASVPAPTKAPVKPKPKPGRQQEHMVFSVGLV